MRNGIIATNHPRSNAVSPSLFEGGRCTLPLREFTVYPYGSMAREATRAIRLFGLRAYSMARWQQTVKGGGAVSEWSVRSRRSKEAPYQNRIIITSVEPSGDVG
jgi:hypothetical protein